MGQRVNIQYSVEIDDLQTEVNRLFGDNKLLKKLTTWDPIYGGKNGNTAIQHYKPP